MLPQVVPLDWWPLTRDCLAYGVTVAFLICIIHDERVEWYEALTLVLLYIVYIAVMYWDKSIQSCARGGVGSTASRRQSESSPTEAGEVLLSVSSPPPPSDVAEEEKQALNPAAALQTTVAVAGAPGSTGPAAMGVSEQINGSIKASEEARPAPEEGECIQLFSCPDGGWWRRVVWVVTWPIHLVFLFTIPDCEKPKFKRLFPLTFFMCIVWIGSLSYVVAWLITIIGDTLKIPDSVMGITFLAAGTSVPEAVSSVIVAKQGHGSMGISNSIGSNTFDILLCLGLPWFIKASFLPTAKGHHYVNINSRGLEYSAISLLSTLLLLYVTFYANKFKLDRKMGQACLAMYVVFLILATLIELNVFFVVNLPTCGR
ncbi:sodium/potassium/calcium exchanger 3 [Frankliniella occidentalis]|uniref:Sodium/potassium/calcium exchanger 3 n=1 Tax=Frankliniella occidentalis TaxID=133901 RepID=A0A9C6XSU0_FRAOC|nr:sodium/potassium/calcium exchanger 3 [Frankliniella occidentalis]